MARGRPNWTRIRGGTGGEWQHASGWTVHHCGHPTANWPYFAAPPGVGSACPQHMMLLTGGVGLGLAFQLLAKAQEAVEAWAHPVEIPRPPVDEGPLFQK